eukprot:295521-Chlamydomonas_euryale.AAC.2
MFRATSGPSPPQDSFLTHPHPLVWVFTLAHTCSHLQALLGPWMSLGALSTRAVLAAAAAPGVDAGRAAAAVRGAEAAEFHRQLALVAAKQQRPDDAPNVSVRQFRWRGTFSGACMRSCAGVPLVGTDGHTDGRRHGRRDGQRQRQRYGQRGGGRQRQRQR